MSAAHSSRTPHHPRKRFGQHFLSDPRILARIADALQLAPHESVVEIGPGTGTLTEKLRSRAGRVVAVELDRDLAAGLRTRFAGAPEVTIVEGDALEQPLGALGGAGFALAGNIPYYITTPIIFHALERPRFSRAVFLVQREVADRITAAAGAPEYGALSANVQAVARAERLFAVPAGAFHPPPRVESAVIRLTPLAQPLVPPEREAPFRRLVIDAFGARRKQMRRVVRDRFGVSAADADDLLARAGIPPEDRPERVSPAQFAALDGLTLGLALER
ncbi:MAG TPA: 16S rRNA (adenine(1518)-N(6)/adenine(1519)-N(6))-dimethyltransferase RsmA [Gemmatimonadaceae bacterium]|nr:16S rRNA (adenine(1518)-N(6)/adenine(1519)-N(6))-dimethyltransferase RsmA [Gemmatimonadaceae bacterium]